LFGPFDIAVDFDKVGKPLDPEVWELIDPAAQRLIEKNVPLGSTVFRAKTGNKHQRCNNCLSRITQGGAADNSTERDPNPVLEDVVSGYIFVDAARTVYGALSNLEDFPVNDEVMAKARSYRRTV
jgi:N-methylhydantoinase B/oxoprolinase/acetone carboxylase alpha subunit